MDTLRVRQNILLFVLFIALAFAAGSGWWTVLTERAEAKIPMSYVRATSHNGVFGDYYFCIWHTTLTYSFDRRPPLRRREIHMERTNDDPKLPWNIGAYDLDLDGHFDRISFQVEPATDENRAHKISQCVLISKDGKIEFVTTWQEGFQEKDPNPIVSEQMVRDTQKLLQDGMSNLYDKKEHCLRDETISLHDLIKE